MKKKEWEKIKAQLAHRWPFGGVSLKIDGYLVTLVVSSIDLFHNGIKVYVDGRFEGKWLTQDCEERRRFMPQRVRSLMSSKQIARYNMLPKRDQKVLKEYREATYIEYSTHWTSWSALVKHFEANNQEIQLEECEEI